MHPVLECPGGRDDGGVRVPCSLLQAWAVFELRGTTSGARRCRRWGGRNGGAQERAPAWCRAEASRGQQREREPELQLSRVQVDSHSALTADQIPAFLGGDITSQSMPREAVARAGLQCTEILSIAFARPPARVVCHVIRALRTDRRTAYTMAP